MPRQNRVTPTGDIIAVPERGTRMGNRGVLHDRDGAIVRAWRLRRWIICRLEFKGRRRAVMTPGRYTELFFLDEATALAAGHRPCAECQRDRFTAFRDAWPAGGDTLPAPALDDELHAARLAEDGTQRTFAAPVDELPDGVLVRMGGSAWLLWGGRLLAWTPGGYGERRRPRGGKVTVLTPRPTVAAIRAGYAPEVHSSAVQVE
jgi:hypothetical protein